MNYTTYKIYMLILVPGISTKDDSLFEDLQKLQHQTGPPMQSNHQRKSSTVTVRSGAVRDRAPYQMFLVDTVRNRPVIVT